jgi:threonine dehydratase
MDEPVASEPAVDLAAIEAAAERIASQTLRTPLVEAPELSAATGAEVLLKLESLQHTGSFKARGALNKLLAVQQADKAAGVVAASAGNHAQGVAYHAGRLGIPAVIVMPVTASFLKVERTRAYGAEVVLAGETVSEAIAEAIRIGEERGLEYVHPFDDPRVIAGQGTIGLEIAAEAGDFDSVVVPIGGGGLIGGISTAIAALRPQAEILGVQSEAFPGVANARAGLPPPKARLTLADGIAVKQPGRLTLPLIDAHVAEVLSVSEAEIERAVAALAELAKLVVEGAGAAGLAALLAQPERFAGDRVVVVICGGNIDPRTHAQVQMRAMVRGGRLVRVRTEVGDAPGRLALVTGIVAERGGNIIEIVHQRYYEDVPVMQVEIDVLMETRNRADLDAILEALNEAGVPAWLMSSEAAGGA